MTKQRVKIVPLRDWTLNDEVDFEEIIDARIETVPDIIESGKPARKIERAMILPPSIRCSSITGRSGFCARIEIRRDSRASCSTTPSSIPGARAYERILGKGQGSRVENSTGRNGATGQAGVAAVNG